MHADADKSSLTDGQIIDLANAAFRDCEGGSLARTDNDLFYLRTVRAALAQAPASGEAVAPFGYCADFETGLYECSHKFYYLAPGQPVPEGCTPFYTTPPAPVPAVRVTDELVERAAREVWKVDRDHWLGGSAAFLELHPSDYARLLAIARAALEAALGQEKENE